jgi:hypothetical protein
MAISERIWQCREDIPISTVCDGDVHEIIGEDIDEKHQPEKRYDNSYAPKENALRSSVLPEMSGHANNHWEQN